MSPSTNLLQNESNWMELERSWWWIGSNAIIEAVIHWWLHINNCPLIGKPCSDFEHWYRRHRILTVHSLEAKNGKKQILKKWWTVDIHYIWEPYGLQEESNVSDWLTVCSLNCGRSANVLIITSLITETIKVYGIQRRLTHVWQTIEKS